MRFLTLIFLLVLSYHTFCQQSESTKVSINLQAFLADAEEDQMVPLLLKSDEDLSPSILQYGGRIRLKINNLYSVEIPAEKVASFLEHTQYEQMDFSTAPGKLLNDSMRANNNIDSLQHFSKRFPSTHSGKGVIMGIIDSGIDFSHPDFIDSTGKTRILYLWDQAVSTHPAQTPQPYNYGVLWDSSHINLGNCTHIEPSKEFGHGTMVAGAAAGNGLATGKYMGAAPSADLIVVASDFNRTNWLQSVAEAVDFIFAKADQLGRPCVINISAGTYAGSHDGQDIASQMIDQLIKSKNGRAVVAAAGNAGQRKFHLGYDVTQDTSFTWFSYEPSFFTNGGIFFEVFSDTADFNQVLFGFGADKTQPSYSLRGHTSFRKIQSNLSTLITDTLKNKQGRRLAIIKTYAELNSGVYTLQVAIYPDSSQYKFRFSTTGSGRLDSWSSKELTGSSDIISSNLPSVTQYPAMLNYKSPDSLQTIVSGFTCLPSVITVANYINRNTYASISGNINMGVTAGEISPNSSIGPTRTGGQKPDIAAPGDIMLSAGKLSLIQQLIQTEPSKISADSMHMRNGGTSMAAPGVAGILALYLEKCRNSSYLELKNALINNVRKDQYTPSQFSIKWGHGKANAFQALQSSNFFPTISSTNQAFCAGDTVLLQANQPYFSYKWNNGDTTSNSRITSSGDYFLIAENTSSCKATSDTIQIQFLPIPSKPLLWVNRDTIYSSYNGKHNWFLNNSQLVGEHSNFLKWTTFGIYQAAAVDTLTSCANFSDTVHINTTSILEQKSSDFRIYPNPSDCLLQIEVNEAASYRISVHSMEGKLLLEKFVYLDMQPYQLNLCPIKAGNYLISFEGEFKKTSYKIQLR